MTLREQYSSILDNMSDERLAIYVNFLNGLENLHDRDFEEVLDELLDEEFCISLAERYDREANKDDPGTPIEVLAEKWGIDLDGEDE